MERWPDRKFIRKNGWDYSIAGLYFITIVTSGRRELLCHIDNGTPILSEIGNMADECLQEIPKVMRGIEIEDYVIMPNHVHFIIANTDNQPVIEAIRRFKAKSSFLWNRMAERDKSRPYGDANILQKKEHLWQRGYYDHIVRNERESDMIRNYIFQNPNRWIFDKLNANCVSDADDVGKTLKEMHLNMDVDYSHYFDST